MRTCFAGTATPLLALFYVSFLLIPVPAQGSDRPNILFLLTDDVGIGDIRTYNPAGKVLLPTIDRLANEGVRFTDAHTSAAKCAPSRYSIITGNYQWRGRKAWGQWNYKGGSQILDGQQTLGDMLKRAGYVTTFIGKYHLGAQFFRKGSDDFAVEGISDDLVDFGRPMTDGPNEHGFDQSFVALRGIQDSPYAFFSNGVLDGSVDDLIFWEVGNYGETRIEKAGIGLSSWMTSGVGPTLLSEALGFIEERHQAHLAAMDDAPFFLFLNNQAVHSPWSPPESIGETPVRGMSGLTVRADLLIEIDAILEALLDALEARNMLEDTLIIVTSDNGGVRLPQEENAGHHVSAGFRGDKGTIYEGGHRVPLILKWGSQSFGESSLPSGSALGALVGIQDIYATLAELTGVQLSESEALDSFSFLPILMGEQAGSLRDHIVHEADRPEDNATDGGISGRHFAYRKGDYKLIFDNSNNPVGFYDLRADPAESSNLIDIAGQQSRIAEMRSEFSNARNSERTAPLPQIDSNAPPSFTSIPLTAATEGAAYSYNITTDDSDGDAVTITASTLPAWLNLTDNGDGTATLSGTPTGADIGNQIVELQADDGNAGTATQSFTITVTASGDGPVISLLGDSSITITVGNTYIDAGATATDLQDGDLTNDIVVDNPVDTSTAGTYAVTYTVTDSAGNSTQAQRTVIVQEAPQSSSPGGGGGGGSASLTEMLTLLMAGVAVHAKRRRILPKRLTS